MIWHHVHEGPSGFWVDLPGGPKPIHFNGHVLSRADFVHLGYRAEHFLSFGAFGVLLLEDIGDAQRRPKFHLWFFDREITFLGNALGAVPAELLDEARRSFDERAGFDLGRREHRPEPRVLVESGVLPLIYGVVLHLVMERLDAVDLRDGVHRAEVSCGAAHDLDVVGVAPERFQDFLLGGEPVDVRLFDGAGSTSFRVSHSIPMEDLRTAFVAADDGSIGHVLLFGVHHSCLLGIWDVGARRMYTFPEVRDDLVRAINALYAKLISGREMIAPYLARPVERRLVPVSIEHLGHHLVNELTGIERLAEALDRPGGVAADTVAFARIGHSEHFGGIDVLFPALAGRPFHAFSTWAALERFVYAGQWMLVRTTGNRISKRMTDGIRALARRTVESADPEFCRTLERRSPREVSIVLGLRVENRTWKNQAEGLIACIRHLLDTGRDVCAIVDGHNSVVGDKSLIFASFAGSGQPEREPIELELEVLQELSKAFRWTRRVRIISLIGDTVARNVVALDSADLFLAPWGAGFAKYKWISDLPGVVVCSHWNLENRPDLGIYERRGLREGQTDNLYLSKEFVRDLPDEPSLISNWGHPSFWNFEVLDLGEMFELIDRTLATVAERRTSATSDA